MAIIVNINQNGIDHVVAIGVSKYCLMVIQDTDASLNCSIRSRKLTNAQNVNVNVFSILIFISSGGIISINSCFGSRNNLRLICSRSIRTGVNLGQNLLAVCRAILGSHLYPLGIISTVCTIYIPMPHKGTACTDFCASSCKSLAERHVIGH